MSKNEFVGRQSRTYRISFKFNEKNVDTILIKGVDFDMSVGNNSDKVKQSIAIKTIEKHKLDAMPVIEILNWNEIN
jgi:hypothetical protein